MEIKTGFDPNNEDQRRSLASYLEAKIPELKDIACAFAANNIPLATLRRMIAQPRGFSEGLRALLKRRPYQSFSRAVYDSDGTRRILRSEISLETGANAASGRRALLEYYTGPFHHQETRFRIENEIGARVARVQLEHHDPLEALLGLLDYHHTEISASWMSPHWTVPIVVPTFETADQTFERLFDLAVTAKERWRDYSPTGETGTVPHQDFQPNRIVIRRFGIYDPKPNETLRDVEGWMERHGARFASYDCFAALLQYPDILQWIEQDPRGGPREPLVSMTLPELRHCFGVQEPAQRLGIHVEASGRYSRPVVCGLGQVYTNLVFPYVLPPEVVIDPKELLNKR